MNFLLNVAMSEFEDESFHCRYGHLFKVWKVVRVLLGVLLVHYYLTFLPYSMELFSPKGIISDPSFNWNSVGFPNLLLLTEPPLGIYGFFILMLFWASLFTFGRATSVAAFFLWYGHACMINANFLVDNPHYGYIGWLIIVYTLIPLPEKFFKSDRVLVVLIYHLTWLVSAMGYLLAGMLKALSPTWVSGQALKRIVMMTSETDNNLAFFLLSMGDGISALMTWSVLALQMMSPLFVFLPRWRWVWWNSVCLMHVILAIIWQVKIISVSMIIFHLFLVDHRTFNLMKKLWKVETDRLKGLIKA